jgi:hypothetical protein
MTRKILAAVLVLAALCASLHAARVKVWHQHSSSQYEKAHFSNTVISNEGTLRLSRQLRPLANLDATHVWDLLEDRDGNLIAATGDEGKIYKITPDGTVSVVFTAASSQVLCLTQTADGVIYAGTGPGGQVIRIDREGKAKVFCETHASYVWSLAVDPATQTLYAGTGSKGRIYHISAEGKASVFYQAHQDHILCVAVGPQSTVYAGTDKGGLVYRIDAKGKGFVLHQAAQAEVRSLKLTGDGLYVGTSAPSRSHGGNSGSSSPSLTAVSLEGTPSSPVSTGPATKTNDKSSETPPAKETSSSKGTPASAPSAPSSGENSVYHIAADGSVRELFREKTMVLSLLRLPPPARSGSQGQFLVGTGMEGQLFEVDEANHERSELARLDHGQILCMCQRKDGSVVLGTGDPGKLYVLRDWYSTKGTVVSEVLDAKLISKWGTLTWQADAPEGTQVSVAVRSGNVAEPDDTWSEWSAEQTDPNQAAMAAPVARFLQYRVTLSTEKNSSVTPTVRGVILRYMTTNLAPEVTKVEVPDLNAVNVDNPKKLKIKWTALDPNEDELTYSVYVRKESWSGWVKLEDDLDKTEYEWDTTTTPSGNYQVKIVASDRKDNADKEALQAERVSVPFVVCHSAPSVDLKVVGMDGDQAVIEAKAGSPLVRLTSASFAVNGKKWINTFPTDGLFDSKSKTFQIKTESLRPGTYVLVLRVKDASGNTGSNDVVFTVQPRK